MLSRRILLSTTAATGVAARFHFQHLAIAQASQSSPEASPAVASAPTVVLVHGAFADASGWAGVTGILQGQGIAVVAPPNPLRSLSGDAAYIASVVDQIPGQVLLVGHSYGGAVITNAAPQASNVVGLVYVAAFAPDEAEALGALAMAATDSLLGPNLRPAEYPAADGSTGHELSIVPEAFHEVFCADLDENLAATMAVSQRPIAETCFGEPSGTAGWATLPSWAVIATADKAIGVSGLRTMAARAGATTVDVEASHVVMISQPQAVADVVLTALAAVS